MTVITKCNFTSPSIFMLWFGEITHISLTHNFLESNVLQYIFALKSFENYIVFTKTFLHQKFFNQKFFRHPKFSKSNNLLEDYSLTLT